MGEREAGQHPSGDSRCQVREAYRSQTAEADPVAACGRARREGYRVPVVERVVLRRTRRGASPPAVARGTRPQLSGAARVPNYGYIMAIT